MLTEIRTLALSYSIKGGMPWLTMLDPGASLSRLG
jgi:hypothetical protein